MNKDNWKDMMEDSRAYSEFWEKQQKRLRREKWDHYED